MVVWRNIHYPTMGAAGSVGFFTVSAPRGRQIAMIPRRMGGGRFAAARDRFYRFFRLAILTGRRCEACLAWGAPCAGRTRAAEI
jgi:hypothetical protein